MEENRLVVNEMSQETGSTDSRNLKKVNINPKKNRFYTGKKSSAMQHILTL